MYKIFLLSTLFLSAIDSFSQDKDKLVVLKGKVTTTHGEAIPFVTVNVKHFSSATMSDQNGNYRLENVRYGDSIRFTHMGYQEKVIVAKGNSFIDIDLERSISTFPGATIKDTVPAEIKSTPEKSSSKIFEKVEIPAYFPGGDKALTTFIQKNLKYPSKAKENRTEGEVCVRFNVDINGNIKQPKIIRGVSTECDAAVMDLIAKMPKWVPAIQNGQNVEATIEIPVSFLLVRVNEG